MTQRNLDALVTPRSVVVIGAGRNPASVGHVVLRNIANGFAGPLAVVHPEADSIAGVACVRSVAALPFEPDLAVIATPPDTVPALIGQLGKKGCRAAVVITAGFGEGNDARGENRRAAMLEAARPHILRILGPNCLGIISPLAGLNASFAPQKVKQGHLALIAQSGAVAVSMLDWAMGRGVGFSLVATLGDMADVDFGDLLDYLAMDEHTTAILLYMEAVTSPRKFMSAARAAARLKPVIVVKGGRHPAGAKAAASHTGALAGADAVYDAAFARAGLMRVETLPDLFGMAELLAGARVPTGGRLAVITNGGGLGVMAADALAGFDGHMAILNPGTIDKLNHLLPATWSHSNPIDIIGDADGARYGSTIDAVLADPDIDAALVIYCPTAVSDADDAAERTIEAARRSEKPVLTAWVGEASMAAARRLFAAARLPSFAATEDAVAAFAQLNAFRLRRAMLMQTPSAAPAVAATADAATTALLGQTNIRAGGWLRGLEAKQIVANYGVPTNATVFAETPDSAAEAAARLGGRVALKIVSPDIVHKSDVGGVVLNLDGAEATRIAAKAMIERVTAAMPAAKVVGFLVEDMIVRRGAHELFIGMTVDRTFGPVIAFGQGGTAVEVIADKALGLPPLNLDLARQMIGATRIGKLLEGYRDRPPVDIDAIARAIVALSALVTDHPEIVDMDINPLLADETGLVAVDVRIRIDTAPGPGLVIAPYPAHLARTISLQDGTRLVIRPIKPEDEPGLREFVGHLAPEDVRFRFFLPLKILDHPLAARLTQIDYDREIAFIAAPEHRPAEFWGVVRLHANPDHTSAEYAVTVRSDKKARGIGATLMTVMLDEAKRRRIGEVWGDVLADNRRMLNLANDMGFTASGPKPGDGNIVRTVKRLSEPETRSIMVCDPSS